MSLSNNTNRSAQRGSLLGLFVSGGIAFVCGWLMTLSYFLVIESGEITDSTNGFVETAKLAGWLYQNGQFAPVGVAYRDGNIAFNLLTDSSPVDVPGRGVIASPSWVYVAIAFLTCAAVSYRRAEITSATGIIRGALKGLIIIPGMLAFSFGSVFLFRIDGIGPHFFLAPLISGLLFPAVAGALGGMVRAYQYKRHSAKMDSGSDAS